MSVLVWADVPVSDLERARRFYSHVLQLQVVSDPNMPNTALVMGDPPSVDLALNMGTPTTEAGTTIYFGTNDIEGMLGRVEEAGGQILQGREFMGPMIGFVAFVVDTEGNRIGIQQNAPQQGQAGS